MESLKKQQEHLDASIPIDVRYDLGVDDKIHLLYINPKLNAQGYYRMIAPALELNKMSTHKAIITAIGNDDFTNTFKESFSELPKALLLWADYIIFPPITDNLKYLLQAIQYVNPQVQLVMDLDKNYFAISEVYPYTQKLKTEKLYMLEQNLDLMDSVLVPTLSFSKFLKNFLNDRFQDSDTLVRHLPTAISKLASSEYLVPRKEKKQSSKIRIGLLQPKEDELLLLKEVIIKINDVLKEKIKWVYFGNPRKSLEVKKLLKEVGCEIHKAVSFSNYLKKLNGLHLDFVLLPAKDGLYNRHKTSTIYLELAILGIPIIASIFHASKQLIKDEETGLLACEPNEWFSAIKLLVENNKLLEKMKTILLKKSWETYGFTKKHLEYFNEIFI